MLKVYTMKMITSRRKKESDLDFFFEKKTFRRRSLEVATFDVDATLPVGYKRC